MQNTVQCLPPVEHFGAGFHDSVGVPTPAANVQASLSLPSSGRLPKFSLIVSLTNIEGYSFYNYCTGTDACYSRVSFVTGSGL